MMARFDSRYAIGDTVIYVDTKDYGKKHIAKVEAVTFTKSKVLYDVRLDKNGDLVERADSVQVTG